MSDSDQSDRKPVSKKPGPLGVGTPFAGESSSGDIPNPQAKRPQLDSDATIVDAGRPQFDPDATIIDAGLPIDPQATLFDANAANARQSSMRRSSGDSSGLYAGDAMLQVGDVLGGRYEILQMLGQGGMGAVYKALDREVDRFVALKLIRPELASNPSILARFKQELVLSQQVTHRNVIRIYDLGDADGLKFITMEFVEGQDLRTLVLERTKFPPEEAVEIIRQVCAALEAAHDAGIIHRDLKPQNIMEDTSGRILLMDFGLARTLDGDKMTQTGAMVGTMDYMSPEQALGKDLDQRSDLFTLGLILYELLTGATPFKAESAIASLVMRTQQQATRLVDVDKNIPATLSNIVAKCLEKDVAKRYQSVEEFDADLAAWQVGKKNVSATSTRHRINRIRRAAMAAARGCLRSDPDRCGRNLVVCHQTATGCEVSASWSYLGAGR